MKVVKIEKKEWIKVVVVIIITAIFAGCIYLINKDNHDFQSSSAGKYVKATILEVTDDKLEKSSNSGLKLGSQAVSLKITEGEHRGEVHNITNEVSQLHNIVVSKGTKVIVTVLENSNNSYNVTIYNYDRTTTLLMSVFIFVALLCIIGGIKGFKAVLGLAFAIIGVMLVLIPLVARGYNPILVAVGVVSVVTLVCFLMFAGVTEKSIAAIIATIIGVSIAGIFAYLVQVLGHLSGFNMAEAESLMLISGDNQFYIKGLLVAGVIIAALGAVMDVAMSIASAVNELNVVNPDLSYQQLVNSGMNVGKDAMGTMANTLILAFTGSSLNLLLLVFSYGISFTQFINNDSIAIELLQGIAGSIGIVICVPVAAIVTAVIVKKKKRNC